MFDFGPAPNELTQNSFLRCPTNVSVANPFRAQNHGLLDSSQRMERSSSGDCFIACPELFVSMEPWRQYSLLTLPRGRNSVALSVGQSFLPITTTTVSPALHHKSSVLWTRSNPPVEFRGSHHDVVCEGTNRPQPHSSFLNSHPLVVSQSNYPTGDSLSPSSLDNSSQGTSQDLDEFRADLNSTDPLMTDVVGDPETWPFTYSKLFGHLDPDQCTLCSTPYALQSSGFSSPPATSHTIRFTDYRSGCSSACSFRESPVPCCLSSSESVQGRKPKFFRSPKYHYTALDELQGSKLTFSSLTSGFRKRWNPRCGSIYFRKNRRSKTHIQTQNSQPATSTPQPADDRTSPFHCGSHISHTVFQTDEGYMSDPTITVDHSPYAFNESPTSKRHDTSPSPARRNRTTPRHAKVHGTKRLHLLQFIIKLLHEHKRGQCCTRLESYHHQGVKNADSKFGRLWPSDCVEWYDEEEHIFTIRNPVRLAQLWGIYKGNRNMTFESLCRSLRLYYVSGKLERVRGQRNQYRLLGTVR